MAIVSEVKRRPTQRAPNLRQKAPEPWWWESARFQEVFVAQGCSIKAVLCYPTGIPAKSDYAVRFASWLLVQCLHYIRQRHSKQMEHSAVFLELKDRIEKDWVGTSTTEFVQQLQLLKEEGKITPEEHKAILILYLEMLKD